MHTILNHLSKLSFRKSQPTFFHLSLLVLALSAVGAAQTKTVITRIEEQTGWQTCGACGNNGGGGVVATRSLTRGVTTPSLDGSSSIYSIGGRYTPYANAYWYISHQAPSHAFKSLRYEFDLMIPAASASAPQAIEFECQQRVNGRVYNFAWQADYASRHWRVFNYAVERWESTSVPFAEFKPNVWHHVVAEYHAESSTVVHDALTIDGRRTVVGLRHASKASSNPNEFTNAFQLDLNGSSTPFKVYIDNMTVTYL